MRTVRIDLSWETCSWCIIIFEWLKVEDLTFSQISSIIILCHVWDMAATTKNYLKRSNQKPGEMYHKWRYWGKLEFLYYILRRAKTIVLLLVNTLLLFMLTYMLSWRLDLLPCSDYQTYQTIVCKKMTCLGLKWCDWPSLTQELIRCSFSSC